MLSLLLLSDVAPTSWCGSAAHYLLQRHLGPGASHRGRKVLATQGDRDIEGGGAKKTLAALSPAALQPLRTAHRAATTAAAASHGDASRCYGDSNIPCQNAMAAGTRILQLGVTRRVVQGALTEHCSRWQRERRKLGRLPAQRDVYNVLSSAVCTGNPLGTCIYLQRTCTHMLQH